MSGKLTLISSATASGSASVEFTSGIDSTYDEYVFYFVDIHPSSDDIQIDFYVSTNGGSSYGVTKTTTFFRTYHMENDSANAFGYLANGDRAQSTSPQGIIWAMGDDNDRCGVGELHLFSPSSTSKVKHFYAVGQSAANTYTYQTFPAGYINTTSAINAVKFAMDSGNIDAGQIHMFGVS
jgi:hypothetical protein